MKIGDQTTETISDWKKTPKGRKMRQQVVKTLVSKSPLRYRSKTEHIAIK